MVIVDLTREPALAGATAEQSPARTLLDVFCAAVARHPERVAIDAGDRTLTYAQLQRDARDLAAALRARGVGPGERVGVRVQSGSAQLYVAILGVLHAGAAYVPADADDPPARTAAIWEQADVCATIEDDLAVQLLRDAQGRAGEPAPEDDAWVIFTSGSTGQPKGVAISHRSAAAFVDAEARLWSVEPEDRVLAGLSVAFDASCEEMWLAWSNGAALVPAPRALVRAGTDLGPWLGERGVTVVSTVPTLAAMWDERALATVRLLILGGEACPPELGWRLAACCEVWNTYGPTEATVVSTAARVVVGEEITIGWPLAGWRTAVIDEDGRQMPFGEPGELAIGGIGLGRYLDPLLDAERYAPLPALGWERAYRSGDIVCETTHGLRFVGRRDHQVKLAGRRLELGEVEAQLTAVQGVRAAAAAVQSTAANNKVLVGYVVGEVNPEHARAAVAELLPDGLAPVVVVLDELPTASSGKVDRAALPWPPPDVAGPIDPSLSGTEAWLAQLFSDQLGPVAMSAETDFFASGGSSLAVAKLVSALRERFPSVAVSDVYERRTLGALAERLQELSEAHTQEPPAPPAPSRWFSAAQLFGVLALTALAAVQWVIAAFAYGNIEPDGLPHVGWGWLIAAWLVLASPPAHLAIAALARRALLPRLRPGRYPRDSWLAARVWFLERLGEQCHLARLAGTPFSARYARLIGADVARDARLGSMPTLTSLVHIGAGATVESQVDMHGWWIDGRELTIGEIHIGAGASVGARTLLAPGACVGERAEIEPASVIEGEIPAGEHWGGNPARALGRAGAEWPSEPPVDRPRSRAWGALYGAGVVLEALLALLALGSAVALLVVVGAPTPTLGAPLMLLAEAGAIAATSTVVLALLLAATLRLLWCLVRPGVQRGDGVTAWALWLSGELQESAGAVLFPLYASLYTRRWLRLMGIRVGRRTEISTSTGLSPLVSFGELGHATDDVGYCTARARDGWLRLQPIEVGDRSFIGPGAVLREGTRLGERTLVGALTLAPREAADGTSWLGSPPLELARQPSAVDPARTTRPPRRLVCARAAMDTIRIIVPNTISLTIALLDLLVLGRIGAALGIAAAIALAAPVVLCSGLFSAAVAVAIKWMLIGRYRASRHPLWSSFVWRDEIVNTVHEQLAGEWLLRFALGTPLFSLYLRAMGARVGRGVWCETTAVTEYDVLDLGDGCAVNRGACLMTHVFQDRLLRIGPASVGVGATLGPTSAVLPCTRLGAGTWIGPHAVVLRGEQLPPGTRWRGAPVISAD